MRKRFLITIVVLTIMFAVTVAVRMPHAGRDLNDPYDTPMAMSLIVLANWQSLGVAPVSFAPLLTFPGEANRFVWNSGVRAMDKEGYAYYVSAPPLSWILARFVSQSTGVFPSQDFLEFLNLTLHFVAVGFFFCLCLKICGDSSRGLLAALCGTTVFAFNPLNLWAFFGAYSWHILWLNFWIAALYFFHQQAQSARDSRATLLGMAAANFLMVYTDFQALLCSFVLIVLGQIPRLDFRARIARACSVLLPALAAVLLTFVQYSKALGWHELSRRVLVQASGRSIAQAAPEQALKILEYYGWFFTSEGLLAAILLVLVLIVHRGNFGSSDFSSGARYLFAASAVAAFLQHALMLNWSANHHESVVRGAVPVCIALTAGLNVVLSNLRKGLFSQVCVCALGLCFVAALANSLKVYNSFMAFMNRYDIYPKLGASIREQASSAEVVFAKSEIPLFLPVNYYAGRNIQLVSSREEALEFLRRHPAERGRLFHIDEGGAISSIEGLVE